MGPYTITKVFPSRVVKLEVVVFGHRFKVDGQRVKHYQGQPVAPLQEIDLEEPAAVDVQDKVFVVSVERNNIKDHTEPTYDEDPTEPTLDEGVEEHVVSDDESYAPLHSDEESESSYEDVMILRPPELQPGSETFTLMITIGGAQVLKRVLDPSASLGVLEDALYRKLDLLPLISYKAMFGLAIARTRHLRGDSM